MKEGPCYTLRAPSCMWRRFQSTRRSRSGDDEGLGCNGSHQVPDAGSKRRSRDHDRQQAAQGTTESRKKARWLFTDDEEDVLRSFLAQYTDDDMARFNEDMAHTDKLLDEAAAKLAEGVVPNLFLLPRAPSLLELEEEEEEDSDEGGGGGQRASGCGSDTTIEMFRAFTRTRFHPISERFLCDPGMFDEDVAQEIREEDRFISKVYAWAKERAAEAVEEYDAKGHSSNAGCTQSM